MLIGAEEIASSHRFFIDSVPIVNKFNQNGFIHASHSFWLDWWPNPEDLYLLQY